MDFSSYTEEEVKRWLLLRAIEWDAFPAFVSQAIAPILFIFFPWYYIVLALGLISFLWVPLRYLFVSVVAASIACVWVVFVKWPVAIGSSIYLFVHHQVVAGVVALLWPLLAGFITIPGMIGNIEMLFAKKIGLVPSDEEL